MCMCMCMCLCLWCVCVCWRDQVSESTEGWEKKLWYFQSWFSHIPLYPVCFVLWFVFFTLKPMPCVLTYCAMYRFDMCVRVCVCDWGDKSSISIHRPHPSEDVERTLEKWSPGCTSSTSFWCLSQFIQRQIMERKDFLKFILKQYSLAKCILRVNDHCNHPNCPYWQ